MTTITIVGKNSKAEELVAIPRKEYEELLGWKKTGEAIKEFTPTATQKKALERSRKNRKQRKTMTFHELKRKLGAGN
jgi:hypothetical protein